MKTTNYLPKQLKALALDRQVCLIRFSPCGNLLAAGDHDGFIRRWDASADRMPPLPSLAGHDGWVTRIAFHPDGKRLFSADTWGQMRCWPYADKQPKPLWVVKQAHDGWVRGLAISGDGKLLATCGRDRMVRLWSPDDGKMQHELAGHKEEVFSLAFQPDGQSLVSGDLTGVVKHWDLKTGKISRELSAKVLYKLDRLQDVGGVRCLAFDRAGATLACAGCQPLGGGFVQGTPVLLLFDWQTGKVKETLTLGTNTDGFVHDLHFHPDGFTMGVTSGQPGSGKLFFHRPGEKQPFFLTPAMANCHSLTLHPNGKRLVVSATNAGSNGNGRNLDKNKEYPGNWSPLHVWDIGAV